MAVQYNSNFTGFHNDEYDERITALLATINNQQQTIQELLTTTNNQSQTISTLQNSITTLQNNINTINSKLSTIPTATSLGTNVTGIKYNRLRLISFQGKYTGYTLPSDYTPLRNGGVGSNDMYQRYYLTASSDGNNRWYAHWETSGSIYIHINGGEYAIPTTGTHYIWGSVLYISAS